MDAIVGTIVILLMLINMIVIMTRITCMIVIMVVVFSMIIVVPVISNNYDYDSDPHYDCDYGS